MSEINKINIGGQNYDIAGTGGGTGGDDLKFSISVSKSDPIVITTSRPLKDTDVVALARQIFHRNNGHIVNTFSPSRTYSTHPTNLDTGSSSYDGQLYLERVQNNPRQYVIYYTVDSVKNYLSIKSFFVCGRYFTDIVNAINDYETQVYMEVGQHRKVTFDNENYRKVTFKFGISINDVIKPFYVNIRDKVSKGGNSYYIWDVQNITINDLEKYISVSY